MRVLAEMFGPSRSDSSLVLPLKPLHEMYALPAQRYIESKGGEVRLNALARVRIAGRPRRGRRGARRTAADLAASSPRCRGSRSSRSWLATSRRWRRSSPPPPRWRSKPIVTVNLWYDRAVMDDVFVGLPGREMQWVFDKRRAFGEAASHLSLVASGADALVGADTATLVALAAREVAAAIPGARERRAEARHRHPREARDLLAGARRARPARA